MSKYQAVRIFAAILLVLYVGFMAAALLRRPDVSDLNRTPAPTQSVGWDEF
jgi:hypothetical protein